MTTAPPENIALPPSPSSKVNGSTRRHRAASFIVFNNWTAARLYLKTNVIEYKKRLQRSPCGRMQKTTRYVLYLNSEVLRMDTLNITSASLSVERASKRDQQPVVRHD